MLDLAQNAFRQPDYPPTPEPAAHYGSRRALCSVVKIYPDTAKVWLDDLRKAPRDRRPDIATCLDAALGGDDSATLLALAEACLEVINFRGGSIGEAAEDFLAVNEERFAALRKLIEGGE
jgi:hypothetical protein